jgi:DHA3 family macrolide efflux protein-like MFS transporter
LLTGFIADRLGVENIFIIGGIAISITGILLLCSASVRNLERKDSSTF